MGSIINNWIPFPSELGEFLSLFVAFCYFVVPIIASSLSSWVTGPLHVFLLFLEIFSTKYLVIGY